MNDPNGLVFYEGEYHMFYQYHPYSIVWGPMHWGHAVSRDMLHWEHLPIALYPDSLGDIFSGSAVIDWRNTSRLGEDGRSPMIAIFTHHNVGGESTSANQYQSIAYSNDKGRTWAKYKGNPVLPNPGIKDFRDPKVIWHEESGKWVMVVAAYNKVMLYNSPNLIDWTFVSEFGIEGDTRLWECPDLFPLVVEDSLEVKWVMLVSIQKEGPNKGSATGYFIGDFDGETFSADVRNQQWADYGKDNYAMVTWSDNPQQDGRRLAIGWMSNWQYAESVPTDSWRGAMTLPRELTVLNDNGNYTLRSLPIKELASIEKKTSRINQQIFDSAGRIKIEAGSYLYKMVLTFDIPGADIAGVRMSNERGEHLDVYYDGVNEMYCIDRTKAGVADFNESFTGMHFGDAHYYKSDVQMIIYLDISSVELFADNGRCVMTDIFFPSAPFNKIEFLAEANQGVLKEGYLTELQNT